MAADPLDNPEIWTRPTLDGVPIPGTRVVMTSETARAMKVEQAQQVGYAGAFTAVRGEEMPTLDYRIECADQATRAAVRTWLEVMRIGQKQRAQGTVGSIFKPATYRFQDAHVEHLEIKLVICARIGRWYRPNERSNLWAVNVSFAENKKPIKIGGTTAPRAKTEVEQKIEELNAQNKALEKHLESLGKDK